MTLEWIVFLLLLGIMVGFLAGLLGVGGGGVLVPVFTFVFLKMGASGDNVVHIALGTSMACIVVTSCSSLRAHNRNGAVRWDVVRVMSAGVIIGSFVATYFVSFIDSSLLAIVFSVFMLWTAIKLITSQDLVRQEQSLNRVKMFSVSNGIGAMSTLVSIGGGSLTVPYLVKNNIDIKKAIGTSAAIGVPISVTASLGFLINGWEMESGLDHTFGYIYWPAVILVSTTSFLFAPLGAKSAQYLPRVVLKQIFAGLLVLLSVKMAMLVL